jgi:DNA-binding NarL/FixJ family response regulator
MVASDCWLQNGSVSKCMMVEQNSMPQNQREAPFGGLASLRVSGNPPLMSSSVTSGPTRRRRLFLVENHPITREGFAHLLEHHGDLEVCGHTGSSAKAQAGVDALKPDLVIADLSLSGSSGLDFIKQLKARHPRIPVLVLSSHDESLYAERAVRAGARGYVMKQTPTAEVLNAVRRVLDGELYLSSQMRTRLVHKHFGGSVEVRSTEMDSLTDRELQVFQLLGRGCTTRRIASTLHVSVSTIETHRAHIKEKLHLKNAVELVRRAVEWASSHPK